MKPSYFVALDGMRGLAALLILFHHLTVYFAFGTGNGQIAFLHGHFYLLVDCFLTISGFVIAHSFDAKMDAGMTFLRFMWSRIVRLYPLVVLGTLFGCTVLLALWRSQPQIGPMPITWAFLSGLLLIPTNVLLSYKPYAFPANSSNWSLSFEMLLCILYGLYLVKARYRTLWFIAGFAALGTITAAYTAGSLDIGFFWEDYWLAAGRVLYPFVAGMIIRRSSFFRAESICWGYLGIPALLLVACNPIPVSWQYDAVASLVLLPVLVWLVASAKPLKAFNALSRFGGLISYPLYAIHYPFVVVISNIGKMLHLGQAANQLLAAATMVILVALAFACQKYYDLPVRQRLARLGRSPASLSASTEQPSADVPVERAA
jgi:peptidoglycan/LPS O-acetylase OafA/YrhL